MRTAFKTMPIKTDRKDARGIAQLMRMGWFRPVHCKSVPAQEMRALLTTRRLVLSKRLDYGPAHTDSDIAVHFREPDILHAGDTYWNGVYPMID